MRKSLFAKPLAIHPILCSQSKITARLEDTTSLESPRNLARRTPKEEAHLHRISEQPVRQHTKPETPTRLRRVIGQHLRDGQHGLDAEPRGAEERGVKPRTFRRRPQEDVQRRQAERESEQEVPVRLLVSPPPEIVRPPRRALRLEARFARRQHRAPGPAHALHLDALWPQRCGPVVERDFEQDGLYDEHDEGLHEEGAVEAGAGPVEDL